MSAKEARDRFSDVLGLVYYGKEPVIVEKKGRPMAVVISPEQWARYQEQTKERFFETVDELRRENAQVDPEAAQDDVTATVEEVRQQHYEQEQQHPAHR